MALLLGWRKSLEAPGIFSHHDVFLFALLSWVCPSGLNSWTDGVDPGWVERSGWVSVSHHAGFVAESRFLLEEHDNERPLCSLNAAPAGSPLPVIATEIVGNSALGSLSRIRSEYKWIGESIIILERKRVTLCSLKVKNNWLYTARTNGDSEKLCNKIIMLIDFQP